MRHARYIEQLLSNKVLPYSWQIIEPHKSVHLRRCATIFCVLQASAVHLSHLCPTFYLPPFYFSTLHLSYFFHTGYVLANIEKEQQSTTLSEICSFSWDSKKRKELERGREGRKTYALAICKSMILAWSL